jgi:hypothetical protein
MEIDFGDRVLRRIYGQVTGVWRKLHDEELHNFSVKYCDD